VYHKDDIDSDSFLDGYPFVEYSFNSKFTDKQQHRIKQLEKIGI